MTDEEALESRRLKTRLSSQQVKQEEKSLRFGGLEHERAGGNGCKKK